MISALKITADRIALCGVARPMTLSAPKRRQRRHEQRRDDGEVLRHVVGDRESGQRAAGDQHLLADLDDLDELGRVAVEVHHVAGLARGLGAGLHRHADVGLGERRGVVGAVAAHGDQPALALLRADAGAACPPASPRRGSRRRPASEAMAAAVTGLSPVIITVRMPMRRSSAKRSLMPGFTTSLRWMTPSSALSSATASGVPPERAMRSTAAVELGGHVGRRRAESAEHGVHRALAERGRRVQAGHAGSCAVNGIDARRRRPPRPSAA